MEQMTLFDERQEMVPLATRLRPSSLEEFAGQEHLLGKGKILRQLIEKDQISSMIFWVLPEWERRRLPALLQEEQKQSSLISALSPAGSRRYAL